MKNMKPVWRMNMGKDPKEAMKGFLFADKQICEWNFPHPTCGYRWNFIGSGGDIVAYKTTRTREVKR